MAAIILTSHNISFGYFLLSFNDYVGDIIDLLSLGYILNVLLLNHSFRLHGKWRHRDESLYSFWVFYYFYYHLIDGYMGNGNVIDSLSWVTYNIRFGYFSIKSFDI